MSDPPPSGGGKFSSEDHEIAKLREVTPNLTSLMSASPMNNLYSAVALTPLLSLQTVAQAGKMPTWRHMLATGKLTTWQSIRGRFTGCGSVFTSMTAQSFLFNRFVMPYTFQRWNADKEVTCVHGDRHIAPRYYSHASIANRAIPGMVPAGIDWRSTELSALPVYACSMALLRGAMHPLEFVRFAHATNLTGPKHIATLRKFVRKSGSLLGPISPWRGLLPNMLATFVACMGMGVTSYFSSRMESKSAAVAAWVSGILWTTAMYYPLETAQIAMMSTVGNRALDWKYVSLTSTLQDLLREGGPSRLYLGVGFALMRVALLTLGAWHYGNSFKSVFADTRCPRPTVTTDSNISFLGSGDEDEDAFITISLNPDDESTGEFPEVGKFKGSLWGGRTGLSDDDMKAGFPAKFPMMPWIGMGGMNMPKGSPFPNLQPRDLEDEVVWRVTRVYNMNVEAGNEEEPVVSDDWEYDIVHAGKGEGEPPEFPLTNEELEVMMGELGGIDPASLVSWGMMAGMMPGSAGQDEEKKKDIAITWEVMVTQSELEEFKASLNEAKKKKEDESDGGDISDDLGDDSKN